MSASAPTERGWIGGRRFDLVFFFGSSAAAALVGLVLVAAPALVVPAWWAWLWLFDGPHLFATWTRTYFDAEQRRSRRRLLVGSLLWLLPGPAALAATKLTRSQAPFDLFLLFAGVWSYHHYVRQHYGLLSIYERLTGARDRARRIDSLFLYGSLWGLFGLFLVTHPQNRVALSLPALLPAWGEALAIAVAVVMGAAGVAYASLVAARARRGEPVRPGLFTLLPVLGLSAFSYFVVGAWEPLFPEPQNPEQAFLAVTVVGGIVHGAQYLGIVFAVNRRRYAERGGDDLSGRRAGRPPAPARAQSIASRLGRSPPLAYAFFVLLSLGYLAINAARGTGPIVAFYPETSDLARLFLGLYWGLFFHHYYLDQKIWRPHEDAALRRELGLDGAAANIAQPEPAGAA